jgi:hypothetical protein
MAIRKMFTIAALALAAVAFVVPSSASANPLKWKDDGAYLVEMEHATLQFKGNITFKYLNESNTFTCEANVTLTAEPGTTGTLTTFELVPGTCSGKGIWANCLLKSQEFEPLPVEVHTTTGGFTVTTTVFRLKYEGMGCTRTETNIPYSWIIATVNELEPIASITLYGEEKLGVNFISGSLTANDPKTLGLG